MKRSLTMAVLCLASTVFPTFGAEPSSTKDPKEVLIEFVVLEVAGGRPHALELPRHEVLSHAPNQVDLGGFSYAATTGPDLESTLAALTRDRSVRILQRPRIQTSDQTPASLCVGAIPAGQLGLGPDGKPLMLGLTLDATPFIHSNGVVTLDLHMKQVTRDGSVQTKMGVVPVTTTREAQAKISLRDHETMLMAGLVAPAQEKFARILRSPKDLAEAVGSRAQASNRSKPVETLLLVRPTLLQK